MPSLGTIAAIGGAFALVAGLIWVLVLSARRSERRKLVADIVEEKLDAVADKNALRAELSALPTDDLRARAKRRDAGLRK
jgi:hypothetical protein